MTKDSHEINLQGTREELFPAQVAVWYQLSTPWKRSGGMLSPATEMRKSPTKTAPVRRYAAYPATAPGLRFITFTGPQVKAASATVPTALSSNGLGGETIGSGGPWVPFSPSIAVSPIIDHRPSAPAPSSNALSNAKNVLGANPVANANAAPVFHASPSSMSSSSASAIAISNSVNSSSGGCEPPKPPEKPEPPPPFRDPNGRPNVPTVDHTNWGGTDYGNNFGNASPYQLMSVLGGLDSLK